MHDTFHALLEGHVEHCASALDIGGIDVVGGVERERRCRVDDEVDTLHRLLDRLTVTNVASNRGDPVAHIGIGKGCHV